MSPIILKDADALARYAAEWVITYLNERIEESGRASIVLSGGTTPKKLYELLAGPVYRDEIDWTKVDFFWGDERFVPADDPRNNAKMARESFLSSLNIPKENIHAVYTEGDPGESAMAYSAEIDTYFKGRDAAFDLVLLGLGDNGHTLSLFPGYENIYEKKRQVMAFYLKEENIYRVTMTAQVVNRARKLVFLVSGAAKAQPLFQVMYGQHNPDLFPAQLIQPYSGELIFMVDEAAATDLRNSLA